MLSLQLGFLSTANIGLTFVFQWYLFTRLGPGVETDALFAGLAIPQLMFAVVTGSLMHVLVPLLSGKPHGQCPSVSDQDSRATHSPPAGSDDEPANDEHRHVAWSFLILIGGLFTLLAIFLMLTAPQWVPLTVPGFSEPQLDLTITLTRIQMLAMVLSAVNGVQLAVYHAQEQFLWAELAPLLAGILMLGLLIWTLPRFGVIAAAWITTARMALQTLLLLPGMQYPVRPALLSVTTRRAWQRIKPLLLGTTYYKTDPLIDRMLLSTASTGSLSLYYFAQQLYGAASQVIAKSMVFPMVPTLSRHYQSGNLEAFRSAYYRKLTQLGIFSLLGLLAVWLSGEPLLGLLIGYGGVTADNVVDLWWIMVCLGGTFVGGVLGQVSSSSFYAIGDTSTPTRLGIYSYTIYLPLKILSFSTFGMVGLAGAASLFFLTNCLLQVFFLERQYLTSYRKGNYA